MDIPNLLIFAAFIFNLILSLFVYFRAKKTPANISLIILAFAITAWCLCKYFYREVDTVTEALFWSKLLYFFPVITPIAFLICGLYFPNKKVNKAIVGFLLLIMTAMAWLTILPGTVVKDVLIIAGQEKQVVFGWAYYSLYVFYLPFFYAVAYVVYFRKYLQEKAYVKMQILYLLLGVTAASLPAMIMSLFLPTVGNYSLNWIGQICTIFWISGIAYAIARHRFLDIRLVVARAVSYVLLVAILGFLYAFGVFIFANFFFGTAESSKYTYLSTILALFIAFSFQPLKNFLENITDKLFFKGKYATNELVLTLTQIMASTLSLDELTKKTLTRLLTTMRISRGAFVLFDEKDKLYITQQGGLTISEAQKDTLTALTNLRKVIIMEEENETTKKYLRELNVEICVPLPKDDHESGVLLLGEKKSGDIYSQQDIDVLEIFGPEVSVAIRNAESYEEISKFNQTLKKEVQHATNDLVAANDKLKELDKLKNEFVSVASHELRTPMSAIKSYLWMALEGKGGSLNEKQRYYVERGYNSVDRLIRLVNEMLNISRIESGKIQVILKKEELVTLTQEVVDEVLSRAQELGVTIIINKPDHPLFVHADTDKIKEVLFNLIGNSLKFTPKNGTITISYTESGDIIETKVVDTGTGLEPDDIKKLFQKFGLLPGSYITNQPVSGTGLGLYISRSIILLHDGEINAASEGRGKGTTFSFTLKKFHTK